jgi:ABC-type transporter Mla maintaining outer membrane lipid asymmetry permease subunit MlaE
VKPRRIHIHWAWLPAAVFVVAVSLHRRGVVLTAILVAAGLAVAFYAEWRARRRPERRETD